MNFLVDAQLPRRLARWVREQGHDCLHTLELPEGNRTTDQEISRLALVHQRDIEEEQALKLFVGVLP